MANYATLKAAIAAVIKQNGNNEITGNLLQQQLLAVVNSLGVGYQYMGIATPDTNPGTPDQNVFYFASTAGTYTNFGGIVVNDDEIAILLWNGTWNKEKINVVKSGVRLTQDIFAFDFSLTDSGTTVSFSEIQIKRQGVESVERIFANEQHTVQSFVMPDDANAYLVMHSDSTFEVVFSNANVAANDIVLLRKYNGVFVGGALLSYIDEIKTAELYNALLPQIISDKIAFAGLEYVNKNTIKLTSIRLIKNDGTDTGLIYVDPENQTQQTIIFDYESGRILVLTKENLITQRLRFGDVLGTDNILLSYSDSTGFMAGLLFPYINKSQEGEINVNTNNDVVLGGKIALDGVGFNSAIVARGNTLVGPAIRLVGKHTYRIFILNKSWPVLNLESSYILHIRTTTNGQLDPALYSVRYDGEHEPTIAPYYDVVMPESADFLGIYVRATEDSVIYFRIEDITEIQGSFEEFTHVLPENQGQANSVKRMKQLTDIKWTPAFDLPRLGWTTGGIWYRDVFKKGVEYVGVPYGRCQFDSANFGYNTFKIGLFVPFEAFITSIMNKGTAMEEKSIINVPAHDATYFGMVCAAAVSYALNKDYISTASWAQQSDITNLGYVVNNGVQFDVSTLKIGDVLNDPTVHTAIITDILLNRQGQVAYIEIAESTPEGCSDNPNIYGTDMAGSRFGGTCRRLLWSTSDFYRYWATYYVLRYNNIANVPYTPTPYVAIDDDVEGYAPRNMSCLPYMGSGFRYKYGSIPNTDIVIIAPNYTKMRVLKDGQPWNIDGTTDYYDITGLSKISVGFSALGNYEAYLCNLSGTTEIDKTRPCSWSVVNTITPL